MNIISQMQLNDIEIDELRILTNAKYAPADDKKSGIDYTIQIIPDFKNHKKLQSLWKVAIDVQIKKKNDCFRWNQIKFKAHGYFKFVEDIDDKIRDKLLLYNGTTMIYSYMRTHILNITTSSVHEGFMIPTIDVRAIIDNYLESKEI